MKRFKCIVDGLIKFPETEHSGDGLVEGMIYESDGEIVYNNFGLPCYNIRNLGLKLCCRFIDATFLSNNKLFLVIRPSMKNTSIPVYNYTFAIDKFEAIRKVRLKWGEFDNDIFATELTDSEIENLVISTNNF